MAKENQKTVLEENTSEVPSDNELFAGEVQEELSEAQVFVGDEDFFKSLADSAQTTATQSQPQRTGVGASQLPTAPTKHKRFSTVQKVLVASIVLIAAILLYALLKSPARSTTSLALTPNNQITPAVQQTPYLKPQVQVKDSAQATPQQIQKTEPELPPTQPLSLKVAQNFYLQKNYDKAYAVYNQLHQSLPASTEEELLRDFLQLKMALCLKRAADFEPADRLLRTVSKSHSPVVRVVANYHRSLLEMQKKQYLNARIRAYRTIALIDAVDFDRDWALSLKRDCHFLVAEAVTRKVLSLCGADKDLPEDLWSDPDMQKDPFTNLNEAQLQSFLNSGLEQLSKGLLGPQIQDVEHAGILPGSQTQNGAFGFPSRWSATCHGASIEELLARFAAKAGLDIHWAFGRGSAMERAKDTVRERPVNLCLSAATTQQFVTAAAGCVGLLARQDKKGIVNIFNPADYSSLSEHVSLLSAEAISLWQKFLLTFHSDKRIPNVHFALGLLQSQKGQVAESIAEYKLVANRFSEVSLAPFALLHSSKLKAGLRDYFGARQDLKQLVEQYPDVEITDQAYLYLADTTAKAGLKMEAGRLYRKVYNLSLSLESQSAAALGASKCFYEIKDYESAAKWLTRYISLAKDHKSKDLCSAYFLLGKTNLALGKSQQACDAFQYALAGQLSREEYVETISALVKGYMEQENFVQALDILEDIRSVAFSQKESTEILLLKSKVFRAMGLVDKAIVTLGDRAEYISDPQLKAKISFELSNCYIAKGNLGLARKKLTEILVIVEAGPLAHEIALELADVCLKLGQNSQTISVCSQLLDLTPSARIKQKTLKIMATAYDQQKNYDRAALALLGQWK